MSTPTVREDRLETLLKDLIDLYTPSGKEQEAIELLEERFRAAGVPTERQRVDEDRDNLIIPGSSDEPRVMLVAHVDTVPAFDYETYEYRRTGDRVVGLGAADMKGGAAAVAEALMVLAENGALPPDVMAAFVVGEEEAGDGALALVRQYHAPWALVAEPTDLTPCLAHYGYVEMALTTRGRRMHAAMADPARGAIRVMLEVLGQLTAHLDEHSSGAIYNIRDVNSAQAGFAVPDECEAWIDVHVPAAWPVADLAVELEELALRSLPGGNLGEHKVTLSTIHGGYRLPDRGLLPSALRGALIGMELPWLPSEFPSDSDATALWAAGIKPVVIGPGSLAAAHRPDEWVSRDQVMQAARVYVAALSSLGSDDR